MITKLFDSTVIRLILVISRIILNDDHERRWRNGK